LLNFLLFDSVIYNLLSAENQFFIENIDFSTHFVDRLPLPVYAVQQLAETLRPKLGGRGFDYRGDHWNFS